MDNQLVQKCPERIRHSVHISFCNSFRHLYLKSFFCLKILIKIYLFICNTFEFTSDSMAKTHWHHFIYRLWSSICCFRFLLIRTVIQCLYKEHKQDCGVLFKKKKNKKRKARGGTCLRECILILKYTILLIFKFYIEVKKAYVIFCFKTFTS